MADGKAAGRLERSRSPSRPGLGTPAFSRHSRKRGVAMSPARAPPAAWSAAGHPSPLLSWLMSYCFLRSQDSHGRFPEHKVSLRSLKGCRGIRASQRRKRQKEGGWERSQGEVTWEVREEKHASSLSPVRSLLRASDHCHRLHFQPPRSPGKSI